MGYSPAMSAQQITLWWWPLPEAAAVTARS